MNELHPPANRGLLMTAMLAGVMGIDPLNPHARPRKRTTGKAVSEKTRSRRATAKASRRRNRKR